MNFVGPIPPGTDTIGEYLTAIQSARGFSHLTSAAFTSDPSLTQATWVVVFGKLKRGLSKAFCQALGLPNVPIAARDSRLSGTLPFPALQNLDFMYCDFDSPTASQLISALKPRPRSPRKLKLGFFAECCF
jgi:hypothetical protein